MAYWTCVRTQTRREDVAMRHLQLGGFEVYLPRLRVWRISHGRRIETRPPLFPNYCFLWLELQWHSARWCPGVAALIMDSVIPAKVPEAVIADLKSRERNGLIELPSKQGLKRGDRVRILRGPFSGQLALFADMKPRERVEVLFALLGSQRLVTLPRAHVEATGST
jgi:transcriptional antiterminator RfaH